MARPRMLTPGQLEWAREQYAKRLAVQAQLKQIPTVREMACEMGVATTSLWRAIVGESYKRSRTSIEELAEELEGNADGG